MSSYEEQRKYMKAKQDIIQAIKSINDLQPEERERLANELFGAVNVAAVMEMWRRFSGMR